MWIIFQADDSHEMSFSLKNKKKSKCHLQLWLVLLGLRLFFLTKKCDYFSSQKNIYSDYSFSTKIGQGILCD